jgi:hypothetical protein
MKVAPPVPLFVQKKKPFIAANKLNQLRKLKQLTLQEKHMVHEAIKI